MKIVVLDGYTLNPGDLDWQGLEKLGECIIHERTAPHLVVDRARDAEILLTNKTPISRSSITQLKRLKYIGVMATGYNIVDVAAAAERRIPVTNVPTYGTASVAQLTFALILELLHHVGAHTQLVRQGEWSRADDWCFWQYPLIEMEGLTIGLIGYGRIGKQVGRIATAFGMNVLVADPNVSPSELEKQVTLVDLDILLKESDIISLHCPLTAENEKLINRKNISIMKKDAILINTSRGQLIDEHELADALNRNRLAGAGLDVLSKEPPPADNPLLRAKNTLITPHIAWATKAARKRLMNSVVNNVNSYLRGKPVNVVNDTA